jgi:hypothetical protein
VRSGHVFKQLEKLVGTNSVGASRQGFSVAMSNEGAIVGGNGDNNKTGAAWTFWVT